MDIKKHAEEIFQAGLQRVNSRFLLEQVLELQGPILTIKTETEESSIDLSQYKKIKLIGFGKAAAQMAAGLCAVLENKISEGILIVKHPTQTKLPANINILTGSHPVPNEKSLEAGESLLNFCHSSKIDELVLGVISGGASALVESLADNLTIEQLMKTTEHLIASGATIHEINCIRKHLSLLKGGQLACALSPATSVNFILSDVVGDDLGVIGSGPTVADVTTFADAWKIIEKYKLTDKFPIEILERIKNGKEGLLSETPKALTNVKNILVGTNHQALMAAAIKAKQLGYDTIVLDKAIEGEARLAGEMFFNLSQIARNNPTCILGGGETIVTLKGNGKGGRNQEMALAYLCKLQHEPHQIFLSASTDGGDGPTDAAGAFASLEILENAKLLNLNPHEFLAANDSYNFFEKVSGLLKTGPTETNVCDLQILISHVAF